MAGYDITPIDVPGILGAYTGAQDRRINQMLLKRKMDAEDRQIAKEERLASIYTKLRPPGTEGGGQPSSGGGLAAPYATPPVASPAPAPIADGIDRNRPTGSPLSPATFPNPLAPPVVAPTAAPVSVPVKPPATWLEGNKDVLGEMLTVAPEDYFKLQGQLASMDKTQLEATERVHKVIAKAAMQLTSFPPQARAAELQRIAPDLIANGVPAEMIANFDPSDKNLQWLQMEGQDFDKIVAREREDRNYAETVRHNKATEATSAAGVDVRRGALDLSRTREGRIGKGGGKSGGGDRDSLIDSLIAN